MSEGEAACRIDVWLWRARFAKTRPLAVDLVERGKVRLTHNGQQTRLDKASRAVHPGDVLTLTVPNGVFVVRVEAMGERRGPAEEARRLYTLLEEDSR